MVEIIHKKPTPPPKPTSSAEYARFLKWMGAQTIINIHLTTGAKLTGRVAWVDTYSVGFLTKMGNRELIIPKHAVAYYEPVEA